MESPYVVSSAGNRMTRNSTHNPGDYLRDKDRDLRLNMWSTDEALGRVWLLLSKREVLAPVIVFPVLTENMRVETVVG